jgi:hypothetical protein
MLTHCEIDMDCLFYRRCGSNDLDDACTLLLQDSFPQTGSFPSLHIIQLQQTPSTYTMSSPR